MVYVADGEYPARSRPQLQKSYIGESQIHFMVFALDLLALILAYRVSLPLAAYLIELFNTSSLESFHASSEMRSIVYLCVSLGALFSFHLSGHYIRRVPWWSQLQQIAKVIVFAVLVDFFASYALELYYSRIFIAVNWGLAFSLIVAARLGMNLVKSRSQAWRMPAVVVADIQTATDILYAFASDSSMGLVAETILLRDKNPEAIDREELPAQYRNIDILNSSRSYESFILNNPDCFYVVSLAGFRDECRNRLIQIFNQNNIDFAIIPAISQTCIYHSVPEYFFGNDVMLLDPNRRAEKPFGRFLKRSMDIAGASVAIVLFALPLMLVAFMLKYEGQGGTVLYAGTRVGMGGRRFRCWKFRTMEPGTDHLLEEYLANNPEAKAHWDRYFKLPDDPRVQTRTSRFIRKASIDELPQLWNVLKGEMSLVGPRPILESEIEAYGDRIEEYISVRPGITGLWQACGRNGNSFSRRVKWDSWYVRNWTIWGDIIIILKTVQIVLKRSGAS